MELDLKFSRFESAPWGFRLIGGADFDLPLTVVKITEGGLAEQVGLRIGDIIIRINDESTDGMTHTDVQKLIAHCGNNFFFTVYRDENQENFYEEDDVNNEVETINQTTNHNEEREESQLEDQVITENGEEQKTDQQIADIMSGEAEVLKEHNVIGVNFNRIFAKSGICQSSEVFRTLNEEATKTKAEKQQEKCKWTTFLQKPNRPIPKTKQELEQAKIVPYKVQIIKQPKPKVAPDRTPSPPPEPPKEQMPTVEEELEPEVGVEEEEEPLEPPTDSEVPNLEPIDEAADDLAPSNEIRADENPESDINNGDESPNDTTTQPTNDPIPDEERPKTEEEILIERQLTDIQKQLIALSSLPSTIQATLDAVTRQLSELLPTFKIDQLSVTSASESVDKCFEQECSTKNEQECSLTNEETCEEFVITEQCTSSQEVIQNIEYSETVQETSSECNYEFREEKTEQHSEINEEYVQNNTIEETVVHEENNHQEFSQDEHKSKSQKELVLLELEHKQRLIKERSSKRPPKAFGPLTPQERPLVLPGGRRWRRPKDAYNDEFIAEVLSSQAELITGSTLGTTLESSNSGFDPRVNFLKYKKPERHIDLEKSEVYKVIHDIDHGPKRGIEFRPEKVVAETDVRSCVTPVN